MNKLNIVIIIVGVLLITAATMIPINEGFVSPSSPNEIITIMSTLKRLNGFLSNTRNWSDRIELLNKSPVELARHYLKSKQTLE
jgi:hypothetical protein